MILRALLALVFVGSLPCLAVGDTLADIQGRGELVWGADQEGGGPYVYPRDDDPSQVTGFEVEIAERLAAILGAKARFVQGQWDKMPELLRTKKCDIVQNGYEWMPSRLETMEASLPYYIYGLQLLARLLADLLHLSPHHRRALPVAHRPVAGHQGVAAADRIDDDGHLAGLELRG